MCITLWLDTVGCVIYIQRIIVSFLLNIWSAFVNVLCVVEKTFIRAWVQSEINITIDIYHIDYAVQIFYILVICCQLNSSQSERCVCISYYYTLCISPFLSGTFYERYWYVFIGDCSLSHYKCYLFYLFFFLRSCTLSCVKIIIQF